MEHYKISKLLHKSTLSTFVTKKWIQVNDLSCGQYSKNKYSCSRPPAFKSGSCRLRFSQLFLCYKRNLPISDVNYVNKEH